MDLKNRILAAAIVAGFLVGASISGSGFVPNGSPLAGSMRRTFRIAGGGGLLIAAAIAFGWQFLAVILAVPFGFYLGSKLMFYNSQFVEGDSMWNLGVLVVSASVIVPLLVGLLYLSPH